MVPAGSHSDTPARESVGLHEHREDKTNVIGSKSGDFTQKLGFPEFLRTRGRRSSGYEANVGDELTGTAVLGESGNPSGVRAVDQRLLAILLGDSGPS